MSAGPIDGCGCFPTGRHYAGIAHLLRTTVRGLVAEVAMGGDWTDLPIAMLDLETTGRDPASDRIVEIGVVRALGGEVVAIRSWLINPGRPIPREASDVHKITDEDVKDAPAFADVAKEVVEFFAGHIPAAYNASFDRAFLRHEIERLKLPLAVDAPALRSDVEWLDPLIWARELQQGERSRALGDVVARLGIALENAHRATNDAEAALRVLLAFGRDVRVPRSYGAFVQEQRRLSMTQADARRNKWR
ncbi:MAG: 3'-5' exonuclease [Polyangiaceae bacterium]